MSVLTFIVSSVAQNFEVTCKQFVLSMHVQHCTDDPGVPTAPGVSTDPGVSTNPGVSTEDSQIV